jgi:outer membrane protein assembly factor BamB
VALAESGNGSGSTGSGSGRTASANAGSASWSRAPQLPPSAGSQSASLATLGSTVIWYGDSMALAYDGPTGDLLWSGASKTPSRAADPRWLGVYGTALVGSVGLGQGATASTQLFGLERGGSIAFSVPVPTGAGGGLQGLNRGVALIAQYSPPALCANSTSTGRNLWSYPWSATTTSAGCDDQHAYAYSDLSLTALDLTSGARIWTTPVSASYGAGTHDYTIFLGGGVVLLVGDTGVFAYDPASGKQLWKSGSWSPYALSDSAIYALSTDDADGPAIASLNPRTGQPQWRYQLTAFTQFASVPAIAPLQSSADSQVVVLPCGAGNGTGFVVLDAATGKSLGAHSIPLPAGSDPLLVAASGTSVFAATPATLYGFTG